MNELVDVASGVSATSGGYTFAIVVLTVVLTLSWGVIYKLWTALDVWKKDYMDLAIKTTTILSEFNNKLDGQDALRNKIDEVHRDILEKKSCGFEASK